MGEKFESSEPSINQISEGEKQLQILLQPLLDEEFSEYTDFQAALNEYQINHPENNILTMVDILYKSTSKLGNTQLELAIQDFSGQSPIENIDNFVGILQERYTDIQKLDIKEETEYQAKETEYQAKETEYQAKVGLDMKAEVRDQAEDGLDDDEIINQLFDKYKISDLEGFAELKSKAISTANEYLKSGLLSKEDKGKRAEDLYKKILILDSKKELIKAYTKSLEGLPQKEKEQKIAEFTKDLEIQKELLVKTDPKLADFILNRKPVSLKWPDDKQKNITNILLYGHEGKQDGNVTIWKNQKITKHEDGSFEKSILSGEMELKVNLPKSIDMADYEVALKKLKIRDDTLKKSGNEIFDTISHIDTKIEQLQISKNNNISDIEIDTIQAEIESLQQERELFIVKLNEVKKEMEKIKTQKEFILSEYQFDVRMYQLELREREDSTINILKFMNKTQVESIGSTTLFKVFEGINNSSNNIDLGNGIIITKINLNDFTLEGSGIPIVNGNAIEEPRYQQIYAQIFNKMISGNAGYPIDSDSLQSAFGNPTFKDENGNPMDQIVAGGYIKEQLGMDQLSGNAYSKILKNLESGKEGTEK